MTNEELIAKIKAEIERRIDAFANICMDEREKGNNESCAYYQGKIASCEGLLSFLSTLESEKPMQEGLDEEINRTYHDGSVTDTSDLDHVSYENIASHFAQWQKDKDTRDMCMSDNRHFQKVYELGRKDMREQMMKEAVEVNLDFTHQITLPFDGPGFGKKGDKVRIIIVKEN